MSAKRSVSRSTVVAAPPGEVFDLLADPRRHAEIDGSGSVQKSLKAPDRLSEGARFGMSMKMGVPYTITNTVVTFDPSREIAWRHMGRHVWRYELEAVPGGTKVVETFDWSTSVFPRGLELVGYPAKNAKGIEGTLSRLEQIFGTP